MAKARKQALKVFKTPIGFHDAYVAAPSRKAALEAWGAGTDLFSAGIAEPVTSTGEAAKAALAKPGEVVRVRRTGGKEDKGGPRIEPGRTRRAQPKAKSKPKPSRATVDKAEAALAELGDRQEVERAELAAEEDRLARRRRALDERHAKAREIAEANLQAAEDRYRAAMRAWEG